MLLGFGLTGLVIRMGPWGIMQECCMIHLAIMQALHDFHGLWSTSDSMQPFILVESAVVSKLHHFAQDIVMLLLQ